MKNCVKCKVSKSLNEFPRRQGRKDGVGSYCRPCLYAYQINRWIKRKQLAVVYLGGKCELCGYDKNFAALDFHHLDPSTKLYDWKKLRLRSWSDVTNELDKCQLLCRNCHAEIHNQNELV